MVRPDQTQGYTDMRPSGRAATALREVSMTTGFSRHAEGSCLIRMGQTEVLCAASVEARVPPFLRNTGLGWVTAEYGMLPRATHTRGDREAARGKQSGRTQEIQRLIGRSLRAVVDRAAMGEMSITLDCDVLNADGGTRCAAITGAWVALSLAFRHLVKMNVLKTIPLTGQVAAVSCGIVGGAPVLDLDYTEDSSADADSNFVLTDDGGIVEIQATAEKTAFNEAQFNELLVLARKGTGALFALQRRRWAADGAQHRARPETGPGQPQPRQAAGDRVAAAAAWRGRGLRRRARPAGAGGNRAGFRRQRPDQGAGGGHSERPAGLVGRFRLLCRRAGWRPGVFSARWAGPDKDFNAAMAAVNAKLGDSRRPPRLVRRRPVHGLAGRPYRDVPRPGRWHGGLAAARRQGVRLRPDVRAFRSASRPSASWIPR